MATEKIILYEIPTGEKSPRSCSPNVLKTRLALNFKGIPFETKWLELPDIAPTLSKLGAAKNEGPGHEYTVPAISVPGKAVPIMDSAAIADYLEEAYPDTPKLFPTPGSRALLAVLMEFITVGISMNGPALAVSSFLEILSPYSQEYFRKDREARLGMKLEDFAAKHLDIPKFVGTFAAVDRMLAAEEGPFLMGEIPSYADLIVVSFMGTIELASPEVLKQIITAGEGRLGTLWEASQKWLR